MNLYDKAIQLLKIRPHYSIELAKKLSLRGFAKLDIEKVINLLTAEGLLNDARYGQQYVEELIRNKSFGFYGLKAKLMQRGIPAPDAESLLKANFPPEKELEIAKRVAAASERRASPIKDGRERAGDIDKIKLAQKLSRKGFRTDIIRTVTSTPVF